MSTVKHAGLSDIGRTRDENQDRWLADPALGLYVVSDGMGGHLAGGLAAEVVVKTLPAILRRCAGDFDQLIAQPSESTEPAESAMAAVLTELSNQLRDESQSEPGLEGMGATVVLALIRDRNALIAHLGDSRAYLHRGGVLRQLTKDHSIVQLLLDSGEISPAEVVDHPARGQLSRCVGMESDPLPEVQSLALQEGDQLLLCSDGLTGMLTEAEIAEILGEWQAPRVACRRLVAAANDAGGSDNITVLVLWVIDPSAKSQDET